MSQRAEIWYRQARGAFYVEIFGKQYVLAKGPNDRPTKAAAERRFHELMAELLAARPVDSDERTVTDVIERFRRFAEKRDAASTIFERDRYLKDFRDFRGERRVESCKPIDLADWVEQHPDWISGYTQHYALRCVMRAFNWAAKSGYISDNPFLGVEWPECPETRRAMTPAEYERALEAAGPHTSLGRALRFLRHTGCRPGELQRLRWEQVFFDTAQPAIVIPRHKTSRTQRTRKPRVIPLTAETLILLQEIKNEGGRSEYVFVTCRGTPWAKNSLSQAFGRLRRRIGLPKDALLYGIRHWVGTNSMEQGNSLRTTADILGQTQLRTTERYVHPTADLARLASALERATRADDQR